ncbi:MAG: fluoride efflux transporter FluC [Acidimicrobiales bacterium]
MPAGPSGDTPRILEVPLRLTAIAGGGALGTLARYGVERALDPAPHGFPWPTFAVNVAGSFLLGLVITLVVERWPPTRFVRPFAAIGFCGGFTTFSTMAVEAVQRAQHGRAGLAAGYLLVSLAAGMLAAAAGMAAARGRLRLPTDHSIPDPDDLAELYSDPRRPPTGRPRP